jgi:hypothetical protein
MSKQECVPVGRMVLLPQRPHLPDQIIRMATLAGIDRRATTIAAITVNGQGSNDAYDDDGGHSDSRLSTPRPSMDVFSQKCGQGRRRNSSRFV